MSDWIGRWIVGVGIFILSGNVSPLNVSADSGPEAPHYVPIEEYAIYDRVMEAKFFTSQTKMIIIERMTTTTLMQEEKPLPLRELFQKKRFFNNSLPPSLLEGFLLKAEQASARLESKFSFPIPVKFVTDQFLDDAEVSIPVIPVHLSTVQKRPGPLPVLGVFRLSRVAFTPARDQALVYIGVNRPDGTGAGFLIWLYQHQDAWDLYGTEVLWVRQ